MLSMLALIAGSGVLGGLIGTDQAMDDTVSDEPQDIITDDLIIGFEEQSLEMNKGELINQLQEGAGRQGFVITDIDQIMEEADREYEQGLTKSDSDPIIIEDYVNIRAEIADDVQELIITDIQAVRAEAMEMNKGDMINKVQEGAGLIGCDDNFAEIIITDIQIIRSEEYEMNKGDMINKVAEGADFIGTVDVIDDFSDSYEMNKGDLINKVQEGSNLISGHDPFISDNPLRAALNAQDIIIQDTIDI